MSTSALLDRPLALILGKGGVGRTTVATALALRGASLGRRVLLLEIRGRDRATALLGHAPIGEAMVEVRPGLFVANVTPEASLREYVSGVLRSERLYRRLFLRASVMAFTGGLPGLDDLMMIGKVRWHIEDERDAGGRPRWDQVVVDAPATGNGLFLLELPAAISGVIQSGPLGFYTRKQGELLRDPARVAAHVVTLAEEMPVAESIELVAALRALHAPVGALIVNRCLPAPFSPEAAALLQRVGQDPGDDSELSALLALGRRAAARWAMQEERRAELRAALPLPGIDLPDLGPEALGPSAMERLAREFG